MELGGRRVSSSSGRSPFSPIPIAPLAVGGGDLAGGREERLVHVGQLDHLDGDAHAQGDQFLGERIAGVQRYRRLPCRGRLGARVAPRLAAASTSPICAL